MAKKVLSLNITKDSVNQKNNLSVKRQGALPMMSLPKPCCSILLASSSIVSSHSPKTAQFRLVGRAEMRIPTIITGMSLSTSFFRAAMCDAVL
jgi:hypothetical protein